MLKLKQITKPVDGKVGNTVVFDGILSEWSSENTGGILVPRGTTAQRPANPDIGLIRFNTDIESLEIFDGLDWVATGESDGYRIISDDEQTWVDSQINPNNVTFGFGNEEYVRVYRDDINAVVESSKENSSIVLKPNGTGSVFIDTDGLPTIEAETGNDFRIVGDNVILVPRTGGKVTIQGEGDSIIETPTEEALLIRSGNSAIGNGTNITIKAGDTSVEGALPGDVVLVVGTNEDDSSLGQVLTTIGYVPTFENSLVNRGFMETYVTSLNSIENVNVITENYTALVTDKVIISKPETDVNITITLPTTPSVGKVYMIKDGRGISSGFPIAISSTVPVDGSMSYAISENYASITIIFDGSSWNII